MNARALVAHRGDRRTGEAGWARIFALVYLCQSVVGIVLLALLMPPLANSDEANHLRRVDQIAHGGLIGHRLKNQPYASGGTVDQGIGALDGLTAAMRSAPDPRLLMPKRAEFDRVRWGSAVTSNFPNTSIYPPVLYFPAVAGAWAGRMMGLGVARTLIIARLFGGIVFASMIAGAIANSGGAAPWLLVWASLPMSISLLSAVTQDGGMLACSAWVVALVVRMGADAGANIRRRLSPVVAIGIALALLGTARPAYAPLASIALVLPNVALRSRVIATFAVVLAILVWSASDAAFVMTNWTLPSGADPAGQIRGLIVHPFRIFSLMTTSFMGRQGIHGQSWWEEQIGVLGALDLVLPGWFYKVATGAIALGLLLTLARDRPATPIRAQGWVAIAACASVILVFALQYVSVTKLGAKAIDNVQGRYFLPIWLILPLTIPALSSARIASTRLPIARLMDVGRIGVVAFTGLSVIVAVMGVMDRYWLL